MASLTFDSALYDEARGAISYGADTFYCMLVTVGYVPNKAVHTRRGDVTNEVVGTGYVAGGVAATVGVTNDTVNHRTVISLGPASWPSSTITARGAVYYKRRGGDPSDDELVAYIDFGGDVVSTNGPFDLTASTLRKQNGS